MYSYNEAILRLERWTLCYCPLPQPCVPLFEVDKVVAIVMSSACRHARDILFVQLVTLEVSSPALTKLCLVTAQHDTKLTLTTATLFHNYTKSQQCPQ